jgi:putative ABC transport system substrate-binding protein
VIVATATPALTIAKEATQARTIPIVMAPVSDPLATGLVESIACPGGHLTGMSMVGPDLSGKRLAFLRKVMPDLESVAFIGSSGDQNTKTFVAGIEDAARHLGLELIAKLVDSPMAIDDGLMADLSGEGVQAVVVQPIFMGYQDQRAAYFIDRIVRGAKPADLPIELPTDYVLFVVNLKTAAAFGLTVPPTVLRAAAEVIE